MTMRDTARLTLEDKVGQLFFLGFQGYALDEETRELLEVVRPGGFVFSQRNIENLDQTERLIEALRETSLLIPLLAVDHEGGHVDRLKHLFAPLPPLSELANSGTSPLRAGSRIIAAELEAAGFNAVLAPVVDLRIEDSVVAGRSLAAKPAEVARLAAAFVEELAKRNIVSCSKHFPGLAGAKRDPHFGLPRIDRSRRQLLDEDILPFIELFDHVPMIMVSHGHYPALGDEKPLPASLSSRIIQGLLRRKLGYRGVIIPDDLTMGAITSVGLTPELFLRAFEAGNDMLLFCQATPLVERAFRTIVKAARSSPALRKRVDESVERIGVLKRNLRFAPVHHRVHARNRIVRQIEKLRTAVAAETVADRPLSF
jgi:beta-N-acetylhexosaminidase